MNEEESALSYSAGQQMINEFREEYLNYRLSGAIFFLETASSFLTQNLRVRKMITLECCTEVFSSGRSPKRWKSKITAETIKKYKILLVTVKNLISDAVVVQLRSATASVQIE